MPSDFTSLFSGELDLYSPTPSSCSTEVLCGPLPGQWQLQSPSQQKLKVMSQKSGGVASSPPSEALPTDIMSSMTTEGNCSGLTTSSRLSMHPGSDQAAAYNSNVEPEEDRSGRPLTEGIGLESINVNISSGANCRAGSDVGVTSQDMHQISPTKRRTVLNISPPPQDLLDNSRMSCQDETFGDSEQSNSIWMEDSLSNFSMMSTASYNDNTEVPRKSRKRTPRQRPGPKSKQGSNRDVFDADSAKGPHFVLSQLGSDKSGPKGSSEDGTQTSNPKGGTLSLQYPAKSEGKELKILVQPETQHRARYLTEGSRGSVKDRTQQGFPTVKLEGVTDPVVLQVFVANDSGRVKPHGFYQACRVTGRNTTACTEVDIGGTTVIEVPLDPSTSMTLAVDCVGILKLRNADVEARIGVAGSKKKSTRARLVFRVNIPRPDGSMLTLQTPSSPILCTQPAGLPEILKKSLHSCSVQGGEEIFIIGKNFLKDTKVIFHENVSDETSWKAEAEIDMELFHQNHLVVKVPPYQTQSITCTVCVGIYVVTNAGRSNDIQPFTYTPDSGKTDVSVKKETVSPTKECSFDNQNEPALVASMLPLVKTEEVTPMEVTSNLQNAGMFKNGLCSQPNANITSGALNKNRPYSSSLQQTTGDPDQGQTFTNTEQLSTIQKQDIAPPSFSVPSGDSLVQQQFLLKPRESVRQDQSSSGPAGVGRLCGDATPQPPQMAVFPSDEVAQLEEAVRQLKAKGYCRISQPDNSLSKQQHIQHQQQLQNQQIQQLQQQQVLDSIQQQLFQSQIQMQCVFQDAGQGKNEQQGSPQVAPNQPSLFQQGPQQQVPMFQSNELLPIQTNFLQQSSSHPSPPMFHSSSALTETSTPQGTLFQKSSQEQVQATLFQNSMSVLQSPEQQPSTSTLFLPQTSLSSQLTANSPQQQQQMAFLNTLQTPNPEPPVYQAQTQLSPIQQRSPMEQQPPPPSQPHSQSAQQATLFQNIPAHPSANPLTANPQQQPQQPGLLFCNNPMSTQDQASSLLFSGQTQINVTQTDRSEPMALGNPSDPRQQIIFQEQQPMQLGNTAGTRQESSVGLFMPPSNMTSLQQDLEIAQSSLFTAQNSVATLQTTTNSPVQQPGALFQTAVSGNINQPNQTQQPGLFMFGIQNECGQLINPAGNTVSDQIIAISQSGQNQRESEARIQSLLSQSASVQNRMTASQNMEKMDELLVSLQDSANSLTRSF
ncbi:nuclear factor of activated T-cells 5 isoform X2 [Periophthalmus magnuspinnatus]|uniref:nuclear factor of activated T-cells 5 isoform X2 n=1 Tax=Periophthalmus magnuspinnatus TaxID=409849 RepID=UPI00145A4C31|nr:nuclear factor of activated T-cells 5 isoform X2 [Periophthalmus magnuspinnatus]